MLSFASRPAVMSIPWRVSVLSVGALLATAGAAGAQGLDGGVPPSPDAGLPALDAAAPARVHDAGAPAEARPEPPARTQTPATPGAGPADSLQLSPEELAELEAEAVRQAEAAAEGAPENAEADPEHETFRLETISILGSREDIPELTGSAHVIDQEELERFEQDDIHRVLQRAPGVYVRAEDGFGLRPNIGIRGASSDRSKKITLLEDSVLLGPAPYSAPAAYYFPIVTRMTGVEVFKGPAAIQHGPQTIGGAINLLTRSIPADSEGEIDLAAGMYGYGKAHGWWGASSKHWGVLLEGAHLQSSGFKDLGGNARIDNTGFDKNELMGKVRYKTAPDAAVYQQLDLKLGYANETSYETYLGLTREGFEEDAFQRYAATQRGKMDWWRTQIELSHLVSFSPEVELRTTAYRHDFERAWEKLNRFAGGRSLDAIVSNPTGGNAVFLEVLRGNQDSFTDEQTLLVGTNDRRYVSQGVQTTLNWRLETGPVTEEIELGARLHYDSIERDHTEDAFLMRSGVLVPAGTDTQQTARNEGSTLAGAFYLQDEVGIGDLRITPGLRVELISSEFENRIAGEEASRFDAILIPGAGIYYQLFPQLGVLAGVYKGFSPVSPGQADSVEPEESINYELGGRFRHDGSRLELIGFLNDYSNIIGECSNRSLRPPLCTPETIGQQFNGGEVVIYGLEATAGQAIDGPWGLTFNVDANYTLTLSEFQQGGITTPDFGEVDEGDRLPYVPIHRAALIGNVEHARWALSVAARYTDAMRDVAGTGDIPPNRRADARVVVDVSGQYFLTEADRLYVNIDNIFGETYVASWRPFGARPGKPFQLQVGYKHHFGVE